MIEEDILQYVPVSYTQSSSNCILTERLSASIYFRYLDVLGHTLLLRVSSVGLFREILVTARTRTFHRVMSNVLLKISLQCRCVTGRLPDLNVIQFFNECDA